MTEYCLAYKTIIMYNCLVDKTKVKQNCLIHKTGGIYE